MAAYADEIENRDSSIQLNLYTTLKRRWEYVSVGIALGIALALLYQYTTVPSYESNIEILVGQRSSELTNSGTITGSSASGDSIHEDILATHMRLLTGRKLLNEVVTKNNLDEIPSFTEAREKGVTPVDFILKNLVVKRGGDGTAREAMVLRASFRDPNPEHAATVLKAIYEGYRTYVESHSQKTTAEAVELIEQARQTHEQELITADQEYREFIKSVPALVDGDQLRDVHSERVNKLEISLDLVRNQLAEQKSRLEVIESASDKSIEDDRRYLALLSQKEVERLKLFLDMTRGETQSEEFQAEQPVRQEAARVQYNRLLELIQKEQALKDSFGESHPLVDLARKEIEITQQFMEQNAPITAAAAQKKLDPKEMLETFKLLLQNDIDELDKRANILTKESAHELSEAKLVENDFMKGAALKARLMRAQARYDQVILRLQEINLSKSYAGFSTDLIAIPEISEKAAWPKLPIVLGLGLLGGCLLGMAFAITADLLDQTIKSVDELEALAGCSVIAHIPRFNLRKIKQKVKDATVDPTIVTFHDSRSAESELYRVARTNLMVNLTKSGVKCIVNTSPQPGDGKSTTLSNLAVAFARTGKKVLLIDADLRRPTIHKLFKLDHKIGLSDYLCGDSNLAQAIVRPSQHSLWIMPHGSYTSQPAEMLESPKLAALIAECKKKFDLILIDAPPLLAVTDPSIIAPIADSLIVTLRIAKNGRRPIEDALKLLRDISIQPAALIVNGVDSGASRSYGYGYYRKDQYGYVGQFHDRYNVLQASQAESNAVEASSI